MNIHDEIQIVDCLCQRDYAFQQVYRCETSICQLLNTANFPFPPIPFLPSRVKGRKRKKVSSLAPEQKSELFLRPLQLPRENAYHLVFWTSEGGSDSFQTDAELVQNLLQLQCQDFRLLRVETVLFHSLDQWLKVELLWENTEDKITALQR